MESTTQLITIAAKWDFEYRYFAGSAASRFFGELKENRRIMGTRCPKCRRLLVPARSFCDACYEATDSWEAVANEGTLEIFTIVGSKFPGLPDPPFVIAYVVLDGADTAILNMVKGLDLSDIDKAGARLLKQPRVRVAYVPELQGRITDFYFELAV